MLTNTKLVERRYRFTSAMMSDEDTTGFLRLGYSLAIRSMSAIGITMPLEPCPACGYALSIADHHCRHCAAASPAIPSRPTKNLQQIIMAVVGALSVLVYLLFFR
jgi:hypothetical protein